MAERARGPSDSARAFERATLFALPLISVSRMRQAFRAQTGSGHGWRKLTLGGLSVCCVQTTIGATARKQKAIEQTRLMSLM